MPAIGKYRGHWHILIFLLWLLVSLGLSNGTTAVSPLTDMRLPQKIRRPPLVLGSSIVSQKTIALMRLYTKYSALTYCRKEMLADFSCKLCQEDKELSGTAHLKVFNESTFGMQAYVFCFTRETKILHAH